MKHSTMKVVLFAFFAMTVVAQREQKTSNGFTCPPQDTDGSTPLNAEPSSELNGGLVCQHSNASGVCSYFSVNFFLPP
jgi:hypothetical protein